MKKHKVGEARKQPTIKSAETEVKKKKRIKWFLITKKSTQEIDTRGAEYKRKPQKV